MYHSVRNALGLGLGLVSWEFDGLALAVSRHVVQFPSRTLLNSYNPQLVQFSTGTILNSYNSQLVQSSSRPWSTRTIFSNFAVAGRTPDISLIMS